MAETNGTATLTSEPISKDPELSPVRQRGTEHIWDAPTAEVILHIDKRAAHFELEGYAEYHSLIIRRNGKFAGNFGRIYCDEEQLRELHADLTAYLAGLDAKALQAAAEALTAEAKGN